MNVLAYIIYLFITYLITFRVGIVFYRNGRVFILHLLHHDEALTASINRLLLVLYYLLNLGYAAVMLSTWNTITSWTELLVSVTSMVGCIVFTLAIIHFCNMTVIYLLGKNNSFKSPQNTDV